MAEETPDLGLQEKLLVVVGTLLGGVVTWVIITQLPIMQATVVSSVLLASLVVTCAYLTNRFWWWMGVGAIAVGQRCASAIANALPTGFFPKPI